MDRLKSLFAALPVSNVETFIASGNVIFDAAASVTATLERSIEERLHEALGYEVITFVRPLADLHGVVTRHPFESVEAEGHSLSIGFLRAPLAPEAIQRLAAFNNGYDEFHHHERELYWLCRGRMSDSKVFGKVLDRALATPVTFRNVTTVRKLAAKAGTA